MKDPSIVMSTPTSDDMSTLTVAELKVLCKENGLSVSGRKADLVTRLDEHLNEESISLEEVEVVPLPDSEEEADTVPLPVIEDEEILEAEFIDAEIIEDIVEPTPASAKTNNENVTLMDQIKNPK
ncbi:MAG: hypothetical protein GWP27_03805, partial [Bacteroidetes bacterium]|nr:hypothetical protein [Bacteroidota bacterium]